MYKKFAKNENKCILYKDACTPAMCACYKYMYTDFQAIICLKICKIHFFDLYLQTEKAS